MKRRMMVMVVCLVAAGSLCGAPQRCLADDPAKKAPEDKKEDTKKGKPKGSAGDLRDGINRAFDGFKKETDKGKKNLNDLYEREKSKHSK